MLPDPLLVMQCPWGVELNICTPLYKGQFSAHFLHKTLQKNIFDKVWLKTLLNTQVSVRFSDGGGLPRRHDESDHSNAPKIPPSIPADVAPGNAMSASRLCHSVIREVTDVLEFFSQLPIRTGRRFTTKINFQFFPCSARRVVNSCEGGSISGISGHI